MILYMNIQVVCFTQGIQQMQLTMVVFQEAEVPMELNFFDKSYK